MKKKLLPWNLRQTDFSRTGVHAEPTLAFELMFEFLRLSPTYELARRDAKGLLSEEERQRLPSDFDQVVSTYKLLGNVQPILFRQWWIKRGLRAFGNPHDKPKTHVIANLKAGVDAEIEDVAENLTGYLSDERRNEGLTHAAIIAVPITLKRAEIMKQLGSILDELRGDDRDHANLPIIKLHGKRLRKKELMTGVRLLWIRSAKPKWELWRLGAYLKLSKAYAETLDHNAGRKTHSTLESYDREMMTKITSRALKKFETIAENAARGKFPCADPVEKSEFDYSSIAKRIRAKNAWEAKEKERLRTLYLENIRKKNPEDSEAT